MKGHGLNLALALLFSLLIWWAIGSHLTEQDQVTIDFRIEVPKDVIARYDGQPSTANTLVLSQAVRVTIQGPKEQIERIGQLGLVGQLALSEEQLQEAFERDPPYVLVDPKKGVAVSEPLEVVEAEPSQLRLELERVKDQLVRVEPGEWIGEPVPGFRRGKVEIIPNRVAVRGPASVLADSYRTMPIDLTGSDENFEADRPLDCPAGVVARTVRVKVEILPDLIEKELEFPITIMRAPGNDPNLEPVPYRIEPREGWFRRIKLRGPKQVLEVLEDDLDKHRLRPDPDTVLPLAYVRSSELPDQLKQPDRDENFRVDVSGLPPGVEVVETPVFPVNLVRVSK